MTHYCPYLRRDKRDRITCEGGTAVFPDFVAKAMYVQSNCASSEGWKTCPKAIMLNSFYERTTP